MEQGLKLYPAQEEGVRRFSEAARARYILAYGTGCGKTATAIIALVSHLKRTGVIVTDGPSPRILVICPAIVRRHWTREFDRWVGLRAEAVEMGRARTSGSKRQLAARDVAYAAPIQIVSYDLLSEVDQIGWHGIIFDEVHHLGDCQSKQSRAAQALMRVNPGCPALGLSATLIPTDLPQLWHPLHLLFGPDWGRFPKAGKVCWDFVARYCHIERSEYGAAPGLPLERKLPELKERLSHVAHRLNREDIAADLPPIDCSILDVPGTGLARTLQVVGARVAPRPEIAHAVEWYRSLPEDITHVVVLCFHRDIATALVDALGPHVPDEISLMRIDGSMPTAQRVHMLERLDIAPAGVLVATSESLREGVRLMWPQKVLFAEWRQSPAQVVQVLGRFYSVGDARRPQIQILSDESLFGQSQRLLERMAACNRVLKAGTAELAVEEVFAPRELDEERMKELTHEMLSIAPREEDDDWMDEEGETDDW